MMGAAPSPYITFVAASRNDDHGGGLLGRMQHFIDGLDEQCRRFGLDAELILVEWNPPAERPRLADALKWPAEPSPLAIRIIEVPADIHARYRHAAALPLYQMIAKNAGIRRARGEFICATNIDILFSDGLMARLARRELKPGVMYRIDRHDSAAEVPLDVPVSEKLDWCAEHVIRVNRRNGTDYPAEKRREYIYAPMALVLLRAALAPIAPLFGGLWYLWKYLFGKPLKGRRPPFAGLRRFIRLQARRKIGAIQALPGFLRRTYLAPLFRYGPFMWKLPIVLARGYAVYVGNIWKTAAFELKRKRLHTNACGDFTLLARKDWERLHGYAEMDTYSFHIDSLLMHAAAAAHIKESVFGEPARIYHIEHASGSGFTPEHQDRLWKRIDRSKITRISDDAFWDMTLELASGSRSPLFNDANWGLVEDDLPETRPGS